MKNTLRFAVLIFTLSHLPKAQAQSQYFWGNFVGFPSTTAGSSDGAGTAANFDHPWGMVLDGAGNLFVADKLNATIRKVTPDGTVSTFAGKAGTTGTTDSSVGTNARFNQISGIAIDPSGNFYVADYANHTIRKVTSAGSVTTPYGTAGTHGHADGAGNAATFYFPTGLTVDKSGNVWVADYSNCVIRKIVPSTGQVTTPYGTAGSASSTDGQGTAARFIHPVSIASDPSGNLYVADVGADVIRKITPGGYVSTFAGTAGQTGTNDGTGSAARFSDNLAGVSTDSNGNVYVGDGTNETIRKITPGGVVTTIGGTVLTIGVENGGGISAQFNLPSGFAVVGNGSTIYMSDYLNNRIVKGTNTPGWHSIKVSATANAANGTRLGATHSTWGLYYYKGTDNNLWAESWSGSAWVQTPLTNDANVSDWLVFGTQYNLLCYLGMNSKICCVYWDGSKWVTSTIGTLPAGVTVSGELVVDNTWNTVYFRATDGLLHAAAWNGSAWVYSTLGTNPNLKGNLAVDQKYHLVYYQGTDNNLWTYQWTGTKWTQYAISTTPNVGGQLGVDVLGLTVYYRSSADSSASCCYWNGKTWVQETLNASANMNSSAFSYSDVAPYPGVYDTLYLDNNFQGHAFYWTGSLWTQVILGDGAWTLTGGLSIQPSLQWAFARRTDGNIIVFGYY